MPRFRHAAPIAAGLALLFAAQPGCGPEPVTPEEAGSIPVFNAEPDYPLKDVNMDNESEFVGEIGGID